MTLRGTKGRHVEAQGSYLPYFLDPGSPPYQLPVTRWERGCRQSGLAGQLATSGTGDTVRSNARIQDN
jgi:hypothetical protein